MRFQKCEFLPQCANKSDFFFSRPPFTASDPMKIYNIILRGIEQIEFPRHVTKTAITIIRKFCRENPTERLGYQKDGINDVKKHRLEIF